MRRLLIIYLLSFWSCDDIFTPCDVEILGECYSIEHTTKINLASKGLTKIPEEIFQFKNLTSLSLSYNNLTEIPVEITSLTKLQYLYLNENQINKMEYSLSELNELKFLNLSNNQINGTLDDSVCFLIDNNCYINLSSNKVEIPLPPCINENINITASLFGEEYSINNTIKIINPDYALNDTIPKAIELFVNLEYLVLNGDLSGSIPKEIGNLTKLTYLSLTESNLNGLIPLELTNLFNLTHLDLSNNQLSGTIPSSIGYLSNLTNLDLSNNQLSGTIPSSIGYLSNLTNLDLSNNQLSGLVPEALCELSPLIIIHSSEYWTSYSRKIDMRENQLCPPYPNCFVNNPIPIYDPIGQQQNEPYLGEQNTENCD